MAETSYIIQNGRRLNLKDSVARKSIGSCDELQTETKHCLVMAVNELCQKVEEINGKEGEPGGVDPTKPLIIGDRVVGCVSYHDNDTKDQFVIKTKIPFTDGYGTSSSGMPMLHVTGGAYGVQKIIDFTVYWYVYQSKFLYAVGCNNGTWKPQYVYLSTYTEGGVKYVALSIKLSAGLYIIDFTVDAYIGKLQQYYTENDFQGWSVDSASGTSIIPQSDIVTVSGVT